MVFVLLFCFIVPIQAENVEPTVQLFVKDADGNIIHSYKKENTYFLFLTRSVDVTNMTMNYDGITPITCTDTLGNNLGVIDEDNKAITADFSVGTFILSDAITTYTVTVMQSSLPSLYIDLADTESIETIHADKEHKAEGSKVTLTDPENTAFNINVGNVEMKGRGNTSWTYYDKKGYQIKFSKKQNVLGLDSAKKWVLLGNTSDASMMSNKLAYDLAANLDLEYSPKGEYVDLWIDGDYRGTYLVSDKIEIGSSRVNIEDGEIISEMDNTFYKNETYFEDLFGNHFVLKDPDAEDENALTSFNQFEMLVDDMEEHLPAKSWSEVTSRLDVDSLAKMYLVNEFMANNEYTNTSQFWYNNDGIIHAGPVWDFDSCTQIQSTADEYYVYNSPIIAQLLQRAEFRSLVRNLYVGYMNQFSAIPSEIDKLQAKLESSATMNYTRWEQLGVWIPKGGVFEPTYEANVIKLKQWINERNQNFPNYTYTLAVDGKSLFLDVDTNRETVTFTYVDTTGQTNDIRFAFWNTDDGQDDMRWYSAQYLGDNTWRATGKLSNHKDSGVFSLHAYDGGTLKSGMNYAIRADVSTDQYNVMYRMYNPNSGEHFYTAALAEKTMLVNAGWIYEGIGWRAPKSSPDPVYRVYNPNAGDHHYTMNWNEMNQLVQVGWIYEGIGWYSDTTKSVPLYRQYNPNAIAGTHNYTINTAERDMLVGVGWMDEGIGWYAYK